MTDKLWFIIFGVIFTVMGLSASLVKRLPVTGALLYLGIGFVLGPHLLNFFTLDTKVDGKMLEIVSEIVVVISLFTAGLKLRHPWNDARWKLAFRLAIGSMAVTVGLIAVTGVFLLGLPLGAAILLGGILAPTDPVLASEVQVEHPDDRDLLRFSLTGEAGFNDGTAFPFVMLGLGVLGLHDLGDSGQKWIFVDVIWASLGGLAIGAGFGTVIAHVVMWFRAHRKETVFLDNFLALGLVALSYGVAVLLGAYGFLAVFAAGLAVRRVERSKSGAEPLKERGDTRIEDGPIEKETPAGTAKSILQFNEQIERLGEVGMVVLLGGMIWTPAPDLRDLWLIPILFVLIRPIAVFSGLWKSRMSAGQVRRVAWFGVRGVGSVYYLVYAINHGLDEGLSNRLTGIVLATVAASILVHGISVTQSMKSYNRE